MVAAVFKKDLWFRRGWRIRYGEVAWGLLLILSVELDLRRTEGFLSCWNNRGRVLRDRKDLSVTVRRHRLAYGFLAFCLWKGGARIVWMFK